MVKFVVFPLLVLFLFVGLHDILAAAIFLLELIGTSLEHLSAFLRLNHPTELQVSALGTVQSHRTSCFRSNILTLAIENQQFCTVSVLAHSLPVTLGVIVFDGDLGHWMSTGGEAFVIQALLSRLLIDPYL